MNSPLTTLGLRALGGPSVATSLQEVGAEASRLIQLCEAHIASVYRTSLSTSIGASLQASPAFRGLQEACSAPVSCYAMLALLCAYQQERCGSIVPSTTRWSQVVVGVARRLGGVPIKGDNWVAAAPPSFDACADAQRAIIHLLCNGILVYQCVGPLMAGIAGGQNALREELRSRGIGVVSPTYAVLMALVECLGDHHPSAPRVGQLVRTLAKLPVVCREAFAVPDDAGYEVTVVHALLRGGLDTSSTNQLAESWGCLGTLFIRAKETASGFIQAHFEPYVIDLLAALETRDGCAGVYVRIRLCLKLLSFVLGDGGFGRARTRLADCPALLAAVLGVVGEVRLSAHPASTSGMAASVTGDTLVMYDAYHVLKVFLVKPKKSLPVRSIISTNRDPLVHFIHAYHASCALLEGGRGLDDASAGAQREEHALLIERVMSTDPLTTDELLDLDALLG